MNFWHESGLLDAGVKRKLRFSPSMSVRREERDIEMARKVSIVDVAVHNVASWPKADITTALTNVRFRG
jgi:hypothetical protein